MCSGRSHEPADSLPGKQRSERPEVQIQVLGPQSVPLAQFGHAVLQEHEGEPDPLLLVLAEISGVEAAQRLALHELAQQLDDGQHEFHQVALDGVGVQVQPVAAGGHVSSPQGDGTCSLTELISALRSMRTRSTSAMRSVMSPVTTT